METETIPAGLRALQVGPASTWGKAEVPAHLLPKGMRVVGKRFLKTDLALSSMEVSLNSMPPGRGMPFVHRHQANEELYLFLEGRGEFQADDAVFPIEPGSCFACAPELGRAWRNTGDSPLVYVVIQAKADSYGPLVGPQDGKHSTRRLAWKPRAGAAEKSDEA